MTIVKVTYMNPKWIRKSIEFTDNDFSFPIDTLDSCTLIVAVMNKFKVCFKPECEIVAVEIVAR